jgi:hypothetical protein
LRGLEKEKRLSFSFQRVYTTTRESKEITIYYDIYILLDWMLQSFFSLIFIFLPLAGYSIVNNNKWSRHIIPWIFFCSAPA